MADYQKLYTTLFNAITDALEEMRTSNFAKASQILVSAQQKTEEMYINSQAK